MTMISDPSQSLIDQITVCTVGINIAGLADTAYQHLLHEAWRADISERTSCSRTCGIHNAAVTHLIRY